MIRHLGPHVDLDGLVADAIEEGRTVRVVSARPAKAASLRAFAEVLALPGWFGHNLDALYDALDDLLEGAGGSWELVWDNVAALREEDPASAAAIDDILTELSSRYPAFHVTVIDR